MRLRLAISRLFAAALARPGADHLSATRPHGARDPKDLKLRAGAARFGVGAECEEASRSKLWSRMPWCLVPVFQPDFDCGGPLFGGERGLGDQLRFDPAGAFVK